MNDTYADFRAAVLSESGFHRLHAKEYEASMGSDYKILVEKMPDWSNRLHTYGNNLPLNELETIFTYGLMTWYTEYLITPYRDSLTIHRYYDQLKQSKITAKFYDLIKYSNLLATLKQNLGQKLEIYNIPVELVKIRSYPNYQILLKDSKWKYASFNLYLLGEGLMQTYLDFIQTVCTACEIAMPNKPSTVHTGCITDFVSDLLAKNNDIITYGIIFQRWKVIIEKLANLCANFQSDKTFDQTAKDKIYSDMLFYDRFLMRIQEIIFYKIKSAIENEFGVISENEDSPVYSVIMNYITTHTTVKERLLFAHNQSDIIKSGVEYFFNPILADCTARKS